MIAELPAYVTTVLERLESKGYEAYIVGGCVRDWLLMRPIHDYDIATNALPTDVMDVFDKTIPTGLRHGTVTVLSCGYPLEVTTYRTEAGYSDGRHPDSVTFCTSIEEDLSRRDFTINAMAMARTGELIDPYGGQLDLQSGQIRTVGCANVRFTEDSLRILRALRFCVQLQFTIEEKTLEAMMALAPLLERISQERIGSEFAKIAADSWFFAVPFLSKDSLWQGLPTAIQSLRPAFQDVLFADTTQSLWNQCSSQLSENQRICLSVAAWCIRSHLSPLQAASIGKAFRWSNGRVRLIQQIVEAAQPDPMQWSAPRWRSELFRFGYEPVRFACIIYDVYDQDASFRRVHSSTEYHASQPIWGTSDLALSGGDLVHLGITGPTVGIILRRLTDAVLTGTAENEHEALLTLAIRINEPTQEASHDERKR